MVNQSFLTPSESQYVRNYYMQCISHLRQEDQSLQQVVNLLPMLMRGVGVHHAGILPLLKEIVEMLFSVGYVKVLFATETFAVGINMPAKAVCFNGLVKYSGLIKRYFLASE